MVSLSFCLFVLLSLFLFVILSVHHAVQMSEGSEVSKVSLCVNILKWQSVTDSVTKVRYRAAWAAKNMIKISKHVTGHGLIPFNIGKAKQ